jgi:hypothetical protein
MSLCFKKRKKMTFFGQFFVIKKMDFFFGWSVIFQV